MKTVKHPIALITTFLWIGFVCAISFLEAWLKFRAPGVTIPIGLGIGRLVFGALNKIEWLFAVVIIIDLLMSKSRFFISKNTLFFIPLTLLILQTTSLLPALDARAELHIHGQTVPPSHLHFYFVGMEVFKVICLSVFGISEINWHPKLETDT